MLALALTISLASGGLLADQSPSTFSARLITGAEQASLENMSRSELEMERASLIDRRPGLGGGIALLAVGGGATLFFGFPILFWGLVDGFVSVAIVGLIVTAIGLGAVTVGIVLLASALATRSANAARVQQIDDRIRAMQENQVPPPPPPPPPGSWLMQVEPSMLVATF